jgi:hypothetical protein
MRISKNDSTLNKNIILKIIGIIKIELLLYLRYLFSLTILLWFLLLLSILLSLFQQPGAGEMISKGVVNLGLSKLIPGVELNDNNIGEFVKYFGYASLAIYFIGTLVEKKIKFRFKVSRKKVLILSLILLLIGYGLIAIKLYPLRVFENPMLVGAFFFVFFNHAIITIINIFIISFINKTITNINRSTPENPN